MPNLYLDRGAEDSLRLTQTGEKDEKKSSLFDHTSLGSISENGRDIDVVSFSRSREVEIDWKKIVDHSDTPGATHPYILGYGLSYLKTEFEKRLKIGPIISSKDLPLINSYLHNYDPPSLLVNIPGYKRICVVSSLKTLPLMGPFFQSVQDYEEFWEQAQFGAFLSDLFLTKLRIVDLAPAIIYRQYRELVALEKVGVALASAADNLVSTEIPGFLSKDQIDDLVGSYSQMRSVGLNIQERIERLRDRASDLGYVLVTTDGLEYKYPDGTVDTLKKGELYQPYETEVSWQSRYERIEFVQIFNFLHVPRRINVTENHRKQVTKYRKIVPDFDPWIEEENRLSGAGYNTFRFSRVGSGYFTQEGDELGDIIDRCELDPEFGRLCAVMLPVYEQGLVSGEILAKYVVVTAPRRGMEPIHTPRIFIEEDLVFSTSYKGAEVGELASSINLAPGEKREIILEKSTKTETEVRRTATSLSDLNESSSADYATELEKEARASKETTTTQSLSASAGGSYGGFSASASGSSSSSQTTKDFARNFSKVARKAARSVTRQTRLELQSSSLQKTTTSSRESTKIEIENINDGRSLNLLFYQLYNVYKARLKLERLSFTYLSGVEVVAGSGIVLPQQFSLDELSSLVDEFSLDGLPVRPNPLFVGNPQEAALERLLDALIRTLKEYHGLGDASSDTVLIPDFPPGGTTPTERIEILTRSLTRLIYLGTEIPLSADANLSKLDTLSEFLIGSPGLYLDAHVGERNATEPYSDEMRAAEVRRQNAEVRGIEAKALYYAALAARQGKIDSPFSVNGVFIGNDKIQLTFEGNPIAGDYLLILESRKVGEFNLAANQTEAEVTVSAPGPWLEPASVDLVRVKHVQSGHEALFLI
ncbi:hypothetical protein [Oricola nitratireducens]|uniref:hypothetical protein n=1 Tax=Oricola nitratireducens TaxID=2775868 RepID=UPI00186756C6|nr:hypothetical protein [Oricola nitratireducens]